MANARNPKRKGHDTSRDQGGFVALPWSVLDCPAYARLSHPARSLLWEIARQFIKDNNGRLLASQRYLETRGWKSWDVITRAKRELLDGGFIHETVMGHRPNKASWYAVTWRTLDRLPGYDAGAAETFRRGAYQQNIPLKNASLTPSRGAERATIAPSHGAGRPATAPSRGAIRATFATSPAPSHGDHLEKPSVVVNAGQGSYKRLTATPTGLFTSLVDWHPISMNDGGAVGADNPKVALRSNGKVTVMPDDDDGVIQTDDTPPTNREIDRDDFGRDFDTDDGYSRGRDPFDYIDRIEVPAWD